MLRNLLGKQTLRESAVWFIPFRELDR